jgi:hypothetical protein
MLVVGVLRFTTFAAAAPPDPSDVMIGLYEAALEDELGLEPGGFYALVHESSRGDTTAPLAVLRAACANSNGDLSSWNALHELYGVCSKMAWQCLGWMQSYCKH